MIAEITLLLIIIAFFSSIRVGVKVDKIFSFITFTSVFLLFISFCNYMANPVGQTFSFVWNSSASGDIKVNITSDAYNAGLIFPFFLITMLSVGSNLIFRQEERRNASNAALLFNLCALIMMVCSNNFVQLLSTLYIIDIMAAILIKDVENSKTFVFQNMIADMLLFTILAVINGKVDTYDIQQILNYRENGEHPDFIAILGLSAVFIKAGLFPFQSGLLALKNIRFHRLQNILFLTSGISALILLLKFHALWNASAFFAGYIHCICFASLLLGFAGLLFIDNIKAKLVYMMLMTNAIVIELLFGRDFVWSIEISCIIISTYTLAATLYFAYYHGGHKALISQLDGQLNISSAAQSLSVLLSTLNIAILAGAVYSANFGNNRVFSLLFLTLFTLGAANIPAQISGKNKNMTQVKTPQNGTVFWISLSAVTSFLIGQTDFYTLPVWTAPILFLIVLFGRPLSFTRRAYAYEQVQNFKGFTAFYRGIILEPLYFCGKILWLLVDWILVEKFIIKALVFFLQLLIRFFRRLHNNKTAGLITVSIVLISLMFISFWRGER